jgi:hypothetical protein
VEYKYLASRSRSSMAGAGRGSVGALRHGSSLSTWPRDALTLRRRPQTRHRRHPRATRPRAGSCIRCPLALLLLGESDGGDLFFCGGGRSGKVRTVRRPKRGSAAGRGSEIGTRAARTHCTGGTNMSPSGRRRPRARRGAIMSPVLSYRWPDVPVRAVRRWQWVAHGAWGASMATLSND